jgi:thiol-disulfide isomerase/thioredoxin
MNWKKILKELAAGIVIVFIFLNIISWVKKPELDSTRLPSGTVMLLDGGSYTFKKGKPVVLHFWATWCRVCQMEVSNIETLSKEYDVLTVAVNSGDDKEVSDYMKTHGLHFKVLNDVDGNWTKRFRVEAFPTTFIYDSKGELRFTEVGYTTTAGLIARVRLSR